MFALPDTFGTWLCIQTNLPVSDPGTDPVVTPPFPPPFFLCATAGQPLVVSSTVPAGASVQWRLTPDGRLLSGLLGGLLLGVDGGGALVLETQTGALSASMVWVPVPTGSNGVYLLQNQGSGAYLVVNDGVVPGALTDGIGVTVSAGPVGDAFLWYLTPSSPLARVGAQYPQGWVPFVDTPESPQATMYGAVSEAVSFGGTADIRSMYSNTNASMSAPTTEPALVAGWTQAAWDDAWAVVSARLATEIGVRNNVLTLYDSLFDQQTKLLATSLGDQEAALASAKVDVTTDTTEVGSVLFDLFSTALYTVLNIAAGGLGGDGGVALSAVANVLNGALTAAAGSGSVGTDPMAVTVAQLWSALVDSTEATHTALSSLFTTILNDPAKSAAVSAYVYSRGPYTLYGNPITNNVDVVGNGWFVAVLQATMGLSYRIYDPGPQGYTIPSGDVQPWQMIGSRYIADALDNGEAPSDTYVLAPLLACGVQLQDLASAQRGWNIPEAVNGPTADHYCCVRILNSTPNALSVAVSGTSAYGPLSSTRIDPYTSQTFMGQSGTGVFAVTELATGASVASFRCMWSYNVLGGQAPIVDEAGADAGLRYGLLRPITVPARDGGASNFKCCSASAALTITYASASTVVLQYAAPDAAGVYYALTAPAAPGQPVTLEPVDPGAVDQQWVATPEGMFLSALANGTCLGLDPGLVDPATGLQLLQLMAVQPGPVPGQALRLQPPDAIVATIDGLVLVADIPASGLQGGCTVLASPAATGSPWTSAFPSAAAAPSAQAARSA